MKLKIAIVASAMVFAAPAIAKSTSNVFHYACKGEGARYAVTVNTDRGVVKMQDHGPSGKVPTFGILSDNPDSCGKGGWTLSERLFVMPHKAKGLLVGMDTISSVIRPTEKRK
jgi:hypothetical protein